MQSSTIYIPHQLDKNEDRYDFFGGHNCIYIPHQLDKNGSLRVCTEPAV